MLWSVIRLIFKTSSVTPNFFYVFNLILSFSTCSQSFKKICVWELLGANVLKTASPNTIQYNTIRVYCENTLSYNNGVLTHTEPKSGSVKARQLIYRYSTNTTKLRVKKLDMEYSIIKIKTMKS